MERGERLCAAERASLRVRSASGWLIDPDTGAYHEAYYGWLYDTATGQLVSEDGTRYTMEYNPIEAEEAQAAAIGAADEEEGA
ncbi:MAG: OCRE domain-containing protein [Senegalimassilia faecalis]